jgi:hypothetical protein
LFKESSGEMVDSCFLCRNGSTLLGTSVMKFYNWVDDKMTVEMWNEQEELRYKEIEKRLENDPEFQKLVDEIIQVLFRE